MVEAQAEREGERLHEGGMVPFSFSFFSVSFCKVVCTYGFIHGVLVSASLSSEEEGRDGGRSNWSGRSQQRVGLPDPQFPLSISGAFLLFLCLTAAPRACICMCRILFYLCVYVHLG